MILPHAKTKTGVLVAFSDPVALPPDLNETILATAVTPLCARGKSVAPRLDACSG